MPLFPRSFAGIVFDSGLVEISEGEHYFVRVSRNLRPNCVHLSCESASKGDGIRFESEGVVEKIWRLAFERIYPSESDGPRNARLHRRNRDTDTIRTQVLISDIDDRSSQRIDRATFSVEIEVGGRS